MSEDNLTEKKESRASYHRNYYAQNRDRILKQRQKRYTTDEDYRKNQLRKRRIERHLTTGEHYGSLTTEEEVEKEVKHDCIMKVLSADQTKHCIVKMYTPKGTAMKVGVDSKKLIHWIYKGNLPNARYRNESNWRLFTEYEVRILAAAFAKFRRKARLENYRFRLTKEMSTYIEQKFSELVGGVPADKFVDND